MELYIVLVSSCTSELAEIRAMPRRSRPGRTVTDNEGTRCDPNISITRDASARTPAHYKLGRSRAVRLHRRPNERPRYPNKRDDRETTGQAGGRGDVRVRQSSLARRPVPTC